VCWKEVDHGRLSRRGGFWSWFWSYAFARASASR
jgi:hypothetical protein